MIESVSTPQGARDNNSTELSILQHNIHTDMHAATAAATNYRGTCLLFKQRHIWERLMRSFKFSLFYFSVWWWQGDIFCERYEPNIVVRVFKRLKYSGTFLITSIFLQYSYLVSISLQFTIEHLASDQLIWKGIESRSYRTDRRFKVFESGTSKKLETSSMPNGKCEISSDSVHI